MENFIFCAVKTCESYTIMLENNNVCSFESLRNIHRKTPVLEPFFDKNAGLRPATLLKKRLWNRCFPVNFVKFLRTPFS